MKTKLYFVMLALLATGLSACDKAVRFNSIPDPGVLAKAPGCTGPAPELVGSTTVEVNATSDLRYKNAANVNWYVLLPEGERIFQGPQLQIAVDQVGSYPAAVWGQDNCGERIQVNFNLVVVPSLKDPFISLNNNAQYTRFENVDVQLSAIGANEMYVTFNSTCAAGGQWESYKTTKKMTLPQEGLDVRVFVKFKSAAQETACISDGIIFDKTPPTLKFVKVPPAAAMQDSADFETTAQDNISGVKELECSLDGQPFKVCTAKTTLSGLAYGAHKFVVRATDFAGNVTSDLTYDWSYINNAPTVRILSGPSVSGLKKEATFTFSGEDDSGRISRYECAIDGQSKFNCTSPLSFNVDLGSHEFKVVAFDGAGLQSTPATYNWTVMQEPAPPMPPVVSLVKHPEAVTFELNSDFEFTARHSGVGIRGFYCQLNSEPVTPCASPKKYSLLPGRQVFAVYAIDNDGLKSATVSYSWLIEKKRIPFIDSFVVDSSARKLDVLVVIDNSSSMIEEQRKMGERFSTFVETLKDLDWQLGIITTDASEGSKAWQNGRLLPFEGLPGVYAINAKTPNVNQVFEKTVRRKERGSSNEEGIHSIYKAIHRSENRFLFRENSHVASIIVSDEDERSSGAKLKDVNQPAFLVEAFKGLFGVKNTYSNHSIVLPSGVVSTRQCPQVGDFFAGETYMKLSKMTEGFIGNLCDADYGPILKGIGDNIRAKAYTVQLKCEPSEAPAITISPKPSRTIAVERVGRRLTLQPYPDVGSKVEVEYYCD